MTDARILTDRLGGVGMATTGSHHARFAKSSAEKIRTL